MEEEFGQSKELCPLEGKERDSEASSFTKTSTCMEPSQGKEPEHNKNSSSLGTVELVESIEVTKSKITEMSKSNNCHNNEPCSTEVNVTESDNSDCNLKPETTSRTTECCSKFFEVTLTSMESIDNVKESLSSNLSEKNSKVIDSSTISDATLKKQNPEKECEISSSREKGQEIRNDSDLHQDEMVLKGSGTVDDCDKEQNIVAEDSCSDKKKNIHGSSANTLGQKTPKESNNPQPVTNPQRMRKRKRSEELDSQSTAKNNQNMSRKDVDAEWSIDERKRLLAALESDAGKRHWTAIVNKVKTKNIHQVKHFTENLLAQAKGMTPVHLLGDRDNQLQEWISVCERLRGGQEDIDAKCIPQVMTIAAVEPSSSQEERAIGPNYARIYNFLSCVLRGQATVGLTPIDAKVVLELLQSLEIKIMNADLQKQQSFLKSKYTNVVKDLEQEQIVFAVEELQKEFLSDEAGETSNDSKSLNFYTEGYTSRVDSGHFSSESIERSNTSEPLPTCSSNTVKDVFNLDESKKVETRTPVDIQTKGALRPRISPPSSSPFLFPEADQIRTTSVPELQTSPTDISEPNKSTETTEMSLSDNMVESVERSDTSEPLLACSSRCSPRIKQKQKMVTSSVTKSLRRQKESRRLKLKKIKNYLNKPKLSSLNPVCIPVSLLNVKPKSCKP